MLQTELDSLAPTRGGSWRAAVRSSVISGLAAAGLPAAAHAITNRQHWRERWRSDDHGR